MCVDEVLTHLIINKVLSQEERKLRSISRQIEEMEYKEKEVKSGAWSTELEGRVGHGDEEVGEKHQFHDAGQVLAG
jgi:hypothetical protein